MFSDPSPVVTDVVVIGAGISGLVTAKCLADKGLKYVMLERTGEVGGLWTFRENDYGVMRFTHINVSKYNYCFSDFPFPDDVPDYPHNRDMAKYIVDYMKHNNLEENIRFFRKVMSIDKDGDGWKVVVKQMSEDGQTPEPSSEEEIYKAKFVAIASGHHAKPLLVKFFGQDSFEAPGSSREIIHAVKFKDAITNRLVGKRVLVVGIGNSAVDCAVNCATVGRCQSVYLSTRSGAWVVPNYIFSHPTDLYANRFFLHLPWKLANFVFETVIKLLSGNPRTWKLNPKMKALQTQPTVSPTLIHHIQRGDIRVVPNIQRIEGSRVYFIDGQSAEFDNIVMCTGYTIDLPFLGDSLREQVYDNSTNSIKLYKNVFSPEVGSSLAFIGFVQPASGGVLTMSETQARWFAEMCKGNVKLPGRQQMETTIAEEYRACVDRYYQSSRHTIQKDPILYNDDIASEFGAKPSLLRNPDLAWRLIFGTCGAYQWRLQGPNSWSGAKAAVKKVPVTELMNATGILLVVLVAILLYYFFSFFFSLF